MVSTGVGAVVTVKKRNGEARRGGAVVVRAYGVYIYIYIQIARGFGEKTERERERELSDGGWARWLFKCP